MSLLHYDYYINEFGEVGNTWKNGMPSTEFEPAYFVMIRESKTTVK